MSYEANSFHMWSMQATKCSFMCIVISAFQIISVKHENFRAVHDWHHDVWVTAGDMRTLVTSLQKLFPLTEAVFILCVKKAIDCLSLLVIDLSLVRCGYSMAVDIVILTIFAGNEKFIYSAYIPCWLLRFSVSLTVYLLSACIGLLLLRFNWQCIILVCSVMAENASNQSFQVSRFWQFSFHWYHLGSDVFCV
jgi:hypothetical protein